MNGYVVPWEAWQDRWPDYKAKGEFYACAKSGRAARKQAEKRLHEIGWDRTRIIYAKRRSPCKVNTEN